MASSRRCCVFRARDGSAPAWSLTGHISVVAADSIPDRASDLFTSDEARNGAALVRSLLGPTFSPLRRSGASEEAAIVIEILHSIARRPASATVRSMFLRTRAAQGLKGSGLAWTDPC